MALDTRLTRMILTRRAKNNPYDALTRRAQNMKRLKSPTLLVLILFGVFPISGLLSLGYASSLTQVNSTETLPSNLKFKLLDFFYLNLQY